MLERLLLHAFQVIELSLRQPIAACGSFNNLLKIFRLQQEDESSLLLCFAPQRLAHSLA